MNEHFAIVIGLSNYPRFTDPPADLRGPVNDATAMRDWLLKNGEVDEKNLWFAASSATQPKAARPTRSQLEKAMLWLDQIAQKNMNKGRGRKVGRRLYIYIAGHGFSPVMRQGCLLAGDASPSQVNANVGVSAWLQWLQDANYFREYVLLMDCCMNRVLVATPMPAPVVPVVVNEAPFANFVALAAQRPLKAVEVEIPKGSGTFHGIFTWAFLKGLEGAAANRHGIINGHGMANWLRNAIYPWLTADDRANTDVSMQPEIVSEDSALVFATGMVPMLFEVTFAFPPDAVGKTARLWQGTPVHSSEFTATAEVMRKLPAGLYVVEVPGAGYRQGFEIVRDETVTIAEKGPGTAGTSVDGVFEFDVLAGDDSSEISIVAADFETLMADGGQLRAKLPAGIYKSVIRIGRQIVLQVVLLDRNMVQTPAGTSPQPGSPPDAMQVEVALPQFASAVPFHNAANSHEYQCDAARDAVEGKGPGKRYHKELGTGAEMMIMARNWTASGSSSEAPPWRGVRLADEDGNILVDLSNTGQHFPSGDPFAICRLSVAPGTYYLRHPFDGHTLEQTLVVTRGWRVEAYLLRRKEQDTRPRLSLLMRRIGQAWGQGEDEAVEKARVALADERPLLDSEVRRLLTGKMANPLEGILGAHLLLLARDSGAANGDLDMLNAVVKKLRQLVGDDHPDVEALSLACPDASLRRTRAVLSPPLFERSWRLLVEASYANPALLPVELWQRQLAQAPVPPFLVWSVGEDVRRTYQTALAEAAFGLAEQPVKRLATAKGTPKSAKQGAKREPTVAGKAAARSPAGGRPARPTIRLPAGIDSIGMAAGAAPEAISMLDVSPPMAMAESAPSASIPPLSGLALGVDRGRMLQLQLPQSALAALHKVGR